jgi:hypothetical protein
MSEETSEKKNFSRWYDYDQNLIDVLDMLQAFEEDVHVQAELFLEKIEEAVGKQALEQFYAVSRPKQFGNRWYDRDPVISKAVELLRVIPPDAQRKAAAHFIDSLKKQGISPEVLQKSKTASPE